MFQFISSIQLRWKDDRYVTGCKGLFDGSCKNNKKRTTKCPSNNVLWGPKNRFWSPILRVENALELVGCWILFRAYYRQCSDLQGGFLYKPAVGNRRLKYNVRDGIFTLTTESYAKIKCGMDFSMYPFDTQNCSFVINPVKNLTYEVRKPMP